MSRFKEIHEQKFKLLDYLLSDQELAKSVIYDDADFLRKPDLSSEVIKNSIFDRVYPQRFIPGTPDQKKTYLTISFEDYKFINRSYKSGIIRITAFTHQDLYRSSDGFLRIDCILERIDDLLNDQKVLGIGRMNFQERNPIVINPQYHGEYLIYRIVEFN